MQVELAYGETGLVIDVPDHAQVVVPHDPPALPNEETAVREAVRPWLRGLAGPVAVVFPDLTRPFPHRTVLPPVLSELARVGLRRDAVRLMCATGTHRQASDAEMRALLGDEIVDRHPVHDHVAADLDAHTSVGAVDGVPILIDKAYLECPTRIVMGFVEPHFFAGFSGGPKAVCPGLAALPTVLEAHSPARIAHPRATWLATDGNPVHDFVRAATRLAPPTLSVDVTIDGTRALTGVWASPLPYGHRAACAFVEHTAVTRLTRPADVVVTTNSGYPLDRNLYQSVKGLAAAERAVRDGGTIVAAAACVDGVPAGSAFADLLSAPDFLDLDSAPDQWQLQVLGRVLRRARVLLHSDGLDDTEIKAAQLDPVDDISRTIRDLEPDSLCILPRGPLTVVSVG
ncbi:MAG: nickel-dependent lactate racemase [Actinomycetes bacterium]